MRLSLEALEKRIVPVGYTVNVLGDAGAGQGNTGDLRYCLTQAMLPQNVNSTISIQVAKGATIQLTKKLPDITQTVSIVDTSNATVAGSGNANNPFRIFKIDDGVNANITDLTIEFGFDSSGQGGGAIYNSGTLVYDGGYIQDSQTTKSGGGIYNASTGNLTLNDVSIVGNRAQNSGGGIANIGGTVKITSCNVNVNTSFNGGGGIYIAGGKVSCFQGTQINGNSDAFLGGGVLTNNSSTFNMTGGSISNNYESGNSGGGLYNATGGNVSLTGGVTVGNNTANLFGGGMYLASGSTTNLSVVTVSGNKVTNNAGKGPGIYLQNGANLIRNKLVDNDDPGGVPFQGP